MLIVSNDESREEMGHVAFSSSMHELSSCIPSYTIVLPGDAVVWATAIMLTVVSLYNCG